ncbi:glycerate kinase [Aspergillus cavernicola]|uniref:Glycerate kinase n=1 Tax=Aspergillus cavernicola TaxID=176166 RepID=A0ABR4HBJ8_9EURO
MKILVCPSGFKGSVSPDTAADCIETGILRAMPTAAIRKVPLADGGEGFAHALVGATGGSIRDVHVVGPTGLTIHSFYGILGNTPVKTAVVEMAAAAGLSLVPQDCRDPCWTTTFGVGQLIAAALDEGVERLIIGCGDSGTSDGGAGMLQALGARLVGRDGQGLPRAGGGQSLVSLAGVDFSKMHPGLKHVAIEAVCNWKNILCGPFGVARVYGPQKGASPQQTELLAAALETYAVVIHRTLGIKISDAPGSGASGGLGAGLLLIGARLRPRYEALMEYFHLGDIFNDCDMIITAEGGVDDQTPRGKIPAEVAMRAKEQGIPVIVLAGTVGHGARVNYDVGIDAFTSILQRPSTLEEAVGDTERLLADGAEGAIRMVAIGRGLSHLGANDDLTSRSQAQGSLEFLPSPTPESQCNMAYILRLPDEILDCIIREASSIPENTPRLRSYCHQQWDLYDMAASLTLVCRRFCPIAMPYLYADLVIRCHPKRAYPSHVSKLIHRSCRRNPSLWPLCRRLIVHYVDPRSADPPSADLTTWFTDIRSFALFGLGGDERAWDLLRLALESIPALTDLYLVAGGEYEMDLPRLLDKLGDLGSTKIRKLELEGVSKRGDSLDWAKLQSKAGTAPFTKLRLMSFLQTPKVLDDLIRWPAMLEEFELEYTFGWCYSVLGLYSDWSLATLQPILALHRLTLRTISIRCICIGGLAGFDLRAFGSLEELTLSSAATSEGWQQYSSNTDMMRNMLAPRLRSFHWDLTFDDQQCQEQLSYIGQEEEDWLRALGYLAVKQRCLRLIGIKFTPPGGGCDAKCKYPWDRMDALDREFQPHNIRICYNTPSVSRERLLEFVPEMREGESEGVETPAIPNPYGAGARAPTLGCIDGTFYLTTTVRWTYDAVPKSGPRGLITTNSDNPFIYNGAFGFDNLTVQSTRCATIFDTSQGDWYPAFLARRNINRSSPLGWETFLCSVQWKNSWPIFNNGDPILLDHSSGQNPVQPPFVDAFDEKELNPSWYQLRTPYTKTYSLRRSRSKGLILHANVVTLSDRDIPTAIL